MFDNFFMNVFVLLLNSDFSVPFFDKAAGDSTVMNKWYVRQYSVEGGNIKFIVKFD